MISANQRRSTRYLQLVVKRAFDIAVSLMVLLMLCPLFLLASLAIKLELRGRISSVKPEYCYNQRIQVLRFRSRSRRSETVVGRILRRSGLKLIPMLINVLRGEMSIVGPHCHVGLPSIPVSDQLSRILLNSPFMPGLISFEVPHERTDGELRKIEADLFYISNWSLLLDAKIIFLSVFSKVTYVQNYEHH